MRRLAGALVAVVAVGALAVAISQAAAAKSRTATAGTAIDLGNRGDLHEGVGQADFKTHLAPGSIYTASKFPVALKIHTPTPQWGGVQLESGNYRFIQLTHLRPPGTPPLTGVGYITLESATTATPSVAKTLANLRATPKLKAGPTEATHVAGLPASMFDATLTGDDGPGTGGLSIVPFTVNHHCGFCEKTLHGETKDLKVGGRGQLFRFIVLRVRGRTVVIYIESIYAVQKKHPPAQQFPTFLPYAQKMLSHISFS